MCKLNRCGHLIRWLTRQREHRGNSVSRYALNKDYGSVGLAEFDKNTEGKYELQKNVGESNILLLLF